MTFGRCSAGSLGVPRVAASWASSAAASAAVVARRAGSRACPGRRTRRPRTRPARRRSGGTETPGRGYRRTDADPNRDPEPDGSAEQLGDLARRSPSSGSPRRRRGRSSAPRRRPAPAGPRAAPAAARPGGRAPRPPPAPAPAAAPAAGSRWPPRGTASGSTRPRRRCRRPRCRASAGRRTSAPRLLTLSSHQRSRPTCSTSTTCPCTGWHRGVGGEELRPDPGAVDDRVRAAVAGRRQPVQVEPGDRAAGREHPPGQPVEVDRHLHHAAR